MAMPSVLEPSAVARPDGDGEVLAPVVAEVEVAAPPHHRCRLHPPLDQLEAMERLVGFTHGPHAIAWPRPDAASLGAGAAFDGEHLGDRRMVVDQAVHPREARGKQRALNPGSVVAPHQVSTQAAVAVSRDIACRQPNPAALHQIDESLSCLLRERLHAGGSVAARALRRLDACEAHRLTVLEQDRAAVDHLHHPRFRVEARGPPAAGTVVPLATPKPGAVRMRRKTTANCAMAGV